VTLFTESDVAHYLGIPAPRVRVEVRPFAKKLNAILNAVSKEFEVSERDLKSSRRGRNVARPRQAFYLLARNCTGKSLPEIGRFVGGRDHTTISYGITACETHMENDPVFSARVRRLQLRFI